MNHDHIQFELVKILSDIPEIRAWEEVYNDVFVLAPSLNLEKKMTFNQKEDCLKLMARVIIQNDKKNNTNIFEILYNKHVKIFSCMTPPK
jgi:hypothetical protein